MSIGSVGIPKIAVLLGSVTPPQGDVIDVRVHLGCTKEVSSFELTLQNWNKKYSPGGSTPIIVGANGSIYIGRGTSVPQIITCKVESIEYDEPSVDEHYLKVTGRCWGERLFSRVVSKTYTAQKGEAIIKDLMDSFAGLSHTRSEVELVEDTSTTYALLDYDGTTLWDILKYIAETADLDGAIGYDFRVAPDGKFEFFPLNSKAASVSLVDIPEVAGYKKDIPRVRNKIYVYGAPEKVYPASMDLWTETLGGMDFGEWSADVDETLSQDGTNKVYGSYSIYVKGVSTWPYPECRMRLTLLTPISCGGHNGFQQLNYALRKTGECIGGNYWFSHFYVRLMTDDDNYFEKYYAIADADQQDQRWAYLTDRLGTAYEVQSSSEAYWAPVGNPDWKNITAIEFAGSGVCGPVGVNGWIAINVDKLFFNKGRFSAIEEVAGDELRELSETDEELMSDSECDLRAKSLLAYYKDPAESLTVKTTVLDYGMTPILPGDTVYAIFPNENVDGDYRVDTIEYYATSKDDMTLEVTVEMGKVSPQLADYLFGMRSKSMTVEKLSRTKAGVGQFASGSLAGAAGGAGGNHHISHEVGDVNGNEYSSPAVGGWDPLTGWIAPNFVGPFSDAAAVTTFRTKNKAGSAILDHHLQPSDDAHGNLGAELYRWLGIHSNAITAYDIVYGIRLKNQSDANPLIALIKDYLEFGPGGASALDTWLHRIAPGEIEVRYDLVPTGDNAGKIGYGVSGGTGLRWSEIHAIDIYASQFHYAGNLIPDTDNTYDIGENSTPKRWRNVYLAGVINALAGFNIGAYTIISSARVLQNLTAIACYLVPDVSGAYELGGPSNKWNNLYLLGFGDLGSLLIGGTSVISALRVLQNVTADAAIITTGKFALARLPNGTVGYVLEAEGASDPLYVDPNGRYLPAGHNHAAGNITSGVLDEGRCPNVYSGLITFNGGINSNGYKISGLAGVSGSFTTVDGKTVTVNNGIITAIA